MLARLLEIFDFIEECDIKGAQLCTIRSILLAQANDLLLDLLVPIPCWQLPTMLLFQPLDNFF